MRCWRVVWRRRLTATSWMVSNIVVERWQGISLLIPHHHLSQNSIIFLFADGSSLRGGEHENSLDISQLSQTRDKDSSLVNADHSEISSSSTPVKEMNDSVSDRSDVEDEDDGWVHPMRRAASPGPHKCPPFHPCSKPECRKKRQR